MQNVHGCPKFHQKPARTTLLPRGGAGWLSAGQGLPHEWQPDEVRLWELVLKDREIPGSAAGSLCF